MAGFKSSLSNLSNILTTTLCKKKKVGWYDVWKSYFIDHNVGAYLILLFGLTHAKEVTYRINFMDTSH